MKNPIQLKSSMHNDDEIALSFNREGFSEFLGKLLQTPREEQKTIHLGFDATPSDLRILFEKLDQHVGTQNDVLNEEVSAQISFEDTSDLSIGSIEEFADVDYGSRPTPINFSVTKTYLIGFRRSSEEKTYERQVVQVIASRGNPGKFEIRVRSTEITWPPAIMSLLEKEIRGLSSRTSPEPQMRKNPFFGQLICLEEVEILEGKETFMKCR
ncbi:hypothetical protein SLH49_09285 [Cognatiyoonia sp. IB215446]|uniref:hypothetical protein n=1 Tax=Cognatiyoonia sp. IB215446 TaxID=3097355 RepID=UPI002A1640B7|nr:hypothetical protein [Cognatiyoonia sp. IB215446]MDX8348179.1 hypothetical protein [Cognatiyoonia sp. IB215446]